MRIVDETKKNSKEISIANAVYRDDYRLKLAFSDGSLRTVDLSGFLENARNPLFKKYRLKRNFKRFRVLNGNLVWNDYEMIFPVWNLYRGQIS